jgi:hypothetical protein
MSKGNTLASFSFEKDGHHPNEEVNIVMEVDNSQCSADIGTITL